MSGSSSNNCILRRPHVFLVNRKCNLCEIDLKTGGYPTNSVRKGMGSHFDYEPFIILGKQNTCRVPHVYGWLRFHYLYMVCILVENNKRFT